VTFKQKIRSKLVGVFLLFIIAGALSFPQFLGFAQPVQDALSTLKINLGLDLQGGVHMEFEADISEVEEDQVEDAVKAAQAVIERRVNAYGVSEPLVQTAQSGGSYRIIVELPGVKDVEEAKGIIKDVPFLQFKEEVGDDIDPETQKLIDTINEQLKGQADEALKRVLEGENFEELAKELSQDPGSAENGGDLDFAKRGTFVEEFDAVIFDGGLADGEIYPNLVETQFGWHVIQKVEERMVEVNNNNEEVNNSEQESQEENQTENIEETKEHSTEEKEVRARHILIAKRSIADFPDLQFKETELTGAHLKSAYVNFSGHQGGLSEPQVVMQFDSEGKDLFAEITKRNVGKRLAIYIDGEMVTAPVVQVEITGGEAVITGSYTTEEANDLKKRLDEGALPVPLELVSQQSVDASLGQEDLEKSLKAGIVGLVAVMLYMIIYYRTFGLVAAFALTLYALVLIALFKLTSIGGWPWPITLTLSGIAGFILSIGMAVDANILIYERVREELRTGKSLTRSVREGFRRAWTSIRDGNTSTILTAFILIWFGTGFVKGFALILVLGVLVSLFTAVVIVRNILQALPMNKMEKRLWLILQVKKEKDSKREKGKKDTESEDTKEDKEE